MQFYLLYGVCYDKQKLVHADDEHGRFQYLQKQFICLSESEDYVMEISKSDWKLFRERVPEWQEHYMERLTKEYIKLLSAPGNASDHFWELEKRIKKDKKHPGVIIEMRRSDVIWNLAIYIQDKVITMNELEGFSEDLIEAVKLILSR